MKQGKLNRQELKEAGKAWATLDALADKLPKEGLNDDEKDTLKCLVEARNRLGELLRWQDFHGVWRELQTEKEGRKGEH